MYNIKVEPQDSMELTHGTCLQGHVEATYYELVEAFGEPMRGDGYKTQAEWVVIFTVPQHGDEPDEDVIATIYDWKKYDQHMFSVTEWNIGGREAQSAYLVQDHIKHLRASAAQPKRA